MHQLELSAAARNVLRRELRNHPSIREQLSDLRKLNTMRKDGLIALAQQLKIDVGALITRALEEEKTGSSGYSDADRALMDYSEKHPAFEGQIEFDLSLQMLGKQLTRKARISYSYTPEWEYFDLHKKGVMKGWAQSKLGIDILAVPEGEAWELERNGKLRRRRNVPKWTAVDLGQEGILSEEIWREIDRVIEERCQEEDRRRRAH